MNNTRLSLSLFFSVRIVFYFFFVTRSSLFNMKIGVSEYKIALIPVVANVFL